MHHAALVWSPKDHCSGLKKMQAAFLKKIFFKKYDFYPRFLFEKKLSSKTKFQRCQVYEDVMHVMKNIEGKMLRNFGCTSL